MRLMGYGRHPSRYFAFALLPLLVGGRALLLPMSNPALESAAHDSTAYWLFLTEDAWEASTAPRGLEDIPGRVRTRSHWLRALSVDVPSDRVSELADLHGVTRVQPVRRLTGPWRIQGEVGPEAGASPPGPRPLARVDTLYGGLGPALELLEVPAAHALGFLGTGTRIGILDGLFFSDHVSLRLSPPIAVRDFVDHDDVVEPGLADPPGSGSHGTALWSLISGDWPGNIIGTAPGSGILLARVHDGSDPVSADEDRWVAGLEWLETQGARIVL
ncbi:MAG: hypothetical protein MUO50_15470, partial [Longimicrobiales bacterium]|nr:hypothetical protein [Longimicrobiales bacterium]